MESGRVVHAEHVDTLDLKVGALKLCWRESVSIGKASYKPKSEYLTHLLHDPRQWTGSIRTREDVFIHAVGQMADQHASARGC